MIRFSLHSSTPSVTFDRNVRGFSLLELLIVVTVIAIMCGLLITSYGGGHREAMQRMANQRNAQEIVSLGVCATMGGADFVVKNNKQATVENLITGTVGRDGIWKGKTFRLGGLDPQRLSAALNFVKFDAGLLLYEPAGGQL
ncbi:MAG: type II secretion system protein [Prosthecobacter sp.]|uniref:type II secretion system protein n=1 Tax=Prosthecobacter sp. TaxID=1965333 RepID=UPI0038FF0B0C